MKIGFCVGTCLWLLWIATTTDAAQVNRTSAGANAAAIQATVDPFRSDLGGVNNGVGSSFTTGRREINWDGVPDGFASPNNLPFDFFNVNSPRGVVFDTASLALLRVSANSSNPTNTAARFGEIDPSYTNLFQQVFSSQRLFGVVKTSSSDDTSAVEILFFIPGTQTAATVSGFGAVFSDVDDAGGSGIICFGPDGKQLGNPVLAPATSGGLSFVGVFFNAGERIAKVKIFQGNRIMAPGNIEGVNGNDIVALDDFTYGEPRARDFHPGDFDGDGVADSTVFRPASGTFFVLNSGSATVSAVPFGQNGDIPLEADFDGDRRNDYAVFRPSLGQWWVQRSSDNQVFAVPFGSAGDKPVVGDYDKDGISDFAIWRPSTGTYTVIRSRDAFGTFYSYPFGASGDIPVGAAIAP